VNRDAARRPPARIARPDGGRPPARPRSPRYRRWWPVIAAGAALAGLLALLCFTAAVFLARGEASAVNVAQLVGEVLAAGPLAVALAIHLRRAAPRPAPALQAPAPGTVADADPLTMGVAVAVAALGSAGGARLPALTPYFERAHDRRLREAIRLAADGGPSVFALLEGEPSVGKTRALYEAVTLACPQRALLAPASAGELLDLIAEWRSGRRRPQDAVLWLKDCQRHLYGERSAEAATQLLRLLAGTSGFIAVGTILPRYFADLSGRGRPDDMRAPARELLEAQATRRILVSDRLDSAQRGNLAGLARSDARLEAALEAARADGSVIQHLTGGPELLRGYGPDPRHPGTLFNEVEHALVTSALDARRLGHESPVPGALLAAAADGYLQPWQRPGDPGWAAAALEAITSGRRADGTPTSARGTLCALRAYRTHSGQAEPAYEPDDYLDQGTRRPRAFQPGTAALWDALVRLAADAEDLARLADSADQRGFLLQAARLYRRAVAAGNCSAGTGLLSLVSRVGAGQYQAASWISGHAVPRSPADVALLLRDFRRSGAQFAQAELLQRDFIATVPLDDPDQTAWLLGELCDSRAEESVAALLARHRAQQVALTDPPGVVHLMRALAKAGAEDKARLLGMRAARQMRLDDSADLARMLEALHDTGSDEAVRILLADDPGLLVRLADAGNAASLIAALGRVKADRAALTVLSRDPREYIPASTPDDIAWLLQTVREYAPAREARDFEQLVVKHAAQGSADQITRLIEAFQETGADEASAYLVTQDLSAALAASSAQSVSRLLQTLRGVGMGDAARRLSTAAAERAEPTGLADADGEGATLMLEALLKATDAAAVRVLLAPDAGGQAIPTDPGDIARLLRALRAAGANDAAIEAARWAVPRISPHDAGGIRQLILALQDLGAASVLHDLLTSVPEQLISADDPDGTAKLMDAIRNVNDRDKAALQRLAEDGGYFQSVLDAASAEKAARFRYGRTPEGLPASRWTWADVLSE
jgi:hypothetical protein